MGQSSTTPGQHHQESASLNLTTLELLTTAMQSFAETASRLASESGEILTTLKRRLSDLERQTDITTEGQERCAQEKGFIRSILFVYNDVTNEQLQEAADFEGEESSLGARDRLRLYFKNHYTGTLYVNGSSTGWYYEKYPDGKWGFVIGNSELLFTSQAICQAELLKEWIIS